MTTVGRVLQNILHIYIPLIIFLYIGLSTYDNFMVLIIMKYFQKNSPFYGIEKLCKILAFGSEDIYLQLIIY